MTALPGGQARPPRDLAGAAGRATYAADVRRRYDAGVSIRRIANDDGVEPALVRALIDESRAGRPAGTASLDDLVARGIVEPPAAAKAAAPVPLDCGVSLSEIVIADRG